MKKGMAAILLVVGMTLGSALTMVLNPVGAASALAGTSGTSTSGHQNILQQALSTLVGNGTITQKQSDAVSQQVQKLHDAEPHHAFRGRMGGMGGLRALGRDGLNQLAALLKVSPQTLMTDLKSGQTIAQIAKTSGADLNTVIAALEKEANAEIQKQVTAGRLTQAQATKFEAGIAAMITNLVNGTFAHGFGGGMPGGFGPDELGGPTGPTGPATAPAITVPTPTTVPSTPTTAGSSSSSTTQTSVPANPTTTQR